MLSSIINCYVYPEKKALTKFADALLFPTRAVFGGKVIEYVPEKPNFLPSYVKPEKTEVTSIFLRILFVPVSVILLPITFIACILKCIDRSNTKKVIDQIEKTAKENSWDQEQEKCNICYDVLENGEKIARLRCRQQAEIEEGFHAFHHDCIDVWIRQQGTCPTCRAQAEIIAN